MIAFLIKNFTLIFTQIIKINFIDLMKFIKNLKFIKSALFFVKKSSAFVKPTKFLMTS